MLHEAYARALREVPEPTSEPVKPSRFRSRTASLKLRALGATLAVGAALLVDGTDPQTTTTQEGTKPAAALQAPADNTHDLECEPPNALDFRHVPFYSEGAPEIQPGLVASALTELGVGQIAVGQAGAETPA